MTTRVAMDGLNKVSPISEGYVVKGGVNLTFQFSARPPAPAPMRPSASASAAPAPKDE
jgi:hypothetical protein